jgi:hypothetical protein
MERLALLALALVATVMTTAYSLAQPRPPDDVPAAIERSERPKSKSDAYRFVGKVLEIDRGSGVVKLQTEEGVVATKPRPELLRAARVGDTISVPRQESDLPSAAPRLR